MPKLEVEILTLFPRMCEGYLAESILGKARESGLVEARVTDVREYAEGRHRVTDDAPCRPARLALKFHEQKTGHLRCVWNETQQRSIQQLDGGRLQ